MSEDLQHIYGLALAAHEQGDYERSVDHYEQILACFPDADLVLYNLGLALYELGRFDEAVKAFSRASEVQGNNADTWFNLGLALKRQGRYPEAILAYQRALEIQPGDPDFLYNLARCCQDSGEIDKAVSCYKEVLDIEPEDTAAMNNLAYLLHRQGELTQAEQYYHQLLVLQPGHPAASHMIAALKGSQVEAPPQEYVRDLFDQFSDNFESSLVDRLEYRTPQLLRSCLDTLDGRKEKYTRCVDLGCGTGLAGVAFRSVCKKLIGVDLSPKMVDEARAKEVYDRLEVGEILSFLAKEQDQPCDLMIAADVLTYLGNLSQVMEKASCCCCPGALFCFSTEKSMESGWQLRPTGRYAHHRDYVLQTAGRFGWRMLLADDVDLRREGDDWIRGDIFILQLTEGHGNP